MADRILEFIIRAQHTLIHIHGKDNEWAVNKMRRYLDLAIRDLQHALERKDGENENITVPVDRDDP